MIEQKLTTYFKQFAAITPRAEFLSQSRRAVTMGVQMPVRAASVFGRFREALTTGSALALASFFILALLGGISYVSTHATQVASTAFNNDSLVREATQISFKVQLKDAEYFDESATQVVQALNKLSGGATTR